MLLVRFLICLLGAVMFAYVPRIITDRGRTAPLPLGNSYRCGLFATPIFTSPTVSISRSDLTLVTMRDPRVCRAEWYNSTPQHACVLERINPIAADMYLYGPPPLYMVWITPTIWSERLTPNVAIIILDTVSPIQPSYTLPFQDLAPVLGLTASLYYMTTQTLQLGGKDGKLMCGSFPREMTVSLTDFAGNALPAVTKWQLTFELSTGATGEWPTDLVKALPAPQ